MLKRLVPRTLTLVAGVMLLAAPRADAQEASAWNALQIQVSRAELQSMLANFERAAQSQSYSPEMKAQASQQLRLIRNRLGAGDFQVGDAINLVVEGEEQLSTTFTVQPGPSLSLPVIGRLSLKGVLRSELEEHLRAEIGKFIKDPVVHVQSSMRLAVTGSVVKPGFLIVATNTPLSDLVTLAGGLTPAGQLKGSWIERDNQKIWEGSALQEAMSAGRTVDQMSLHAGDRLVIPEQKKSWVGNGIQTALVSLGSIVMLLQVLSR